MALHHHRMNIIKCLITLTGATVIFVAATTVIADDVVPSRRTARFEVGFMKMMIDHHAMAVKMAKLCTDRAIHDELESLCHDLIAAQSAEIDEMQSWLHHWYGVSYEPHMSSKDRRLLRDLSKRHRKQFEITFMRMMIEHHSVAIEEAEECVDRAFHDELLKLCHNIIDTQTAEVALLQDWLCDWYKKCH